MLGIRYVNDTAIDLWVGDSSCFEVDYLLSIDATSLNELVATLNKLNQDHLRHLGIVLNSPGVEFTKDLFNTLKDNLGSFPKRVTLILNNTQDYKMVQNLMFELILKRS